MVRHNVAKIHSRGGHLSHPGHRFNFLHHFDPTGAPYQAPDSAIVGQEETQHRSR